MLQKTFTEYELQKMAVKLKASLKDKTYVLNSIDFEAAFQCIAHKGYLTNDETNKISAIIKNSWSDYRHFPSYEEILLLLFLGATLDSKFFKIYMPKSILKIQNFKP